MSFSLNPYSLPPLDAEKYALALVKNGIYKKLFFARLEAKRYNKKLKRGLMEPLLCFPDPDIRQVTTEVSSGGYLLTLVHLKPINKHNIQYHYE